MALIVPNQAELNTLTRLITAWGTCVIDLFQNNITPGDATVLADFTVANYSGYTQENVTWGTPATDGTGRGYTLSVTIEFPIALLSSQTVYGWYLRDSGGLLIACKRFDAPVTVTTLATVDPFTIKFTLRQEP